MVVITQEFFYIIYMVDNFWKTVVNYQKASFYIAVRNEIAGEM